MDRFTSIFRLKAILIVIVVLVGRCAQCLRIVKKNQRFKNLLDDGVILRSAKNDFGTSTPNSTKKSTFNRDVSLLFEKLLDTGEDAILHLRRYFLPYYQQPRDSIPPFQPQGDKGRVDSLRPRVVLIGSGWSSHAFLKVCETDAYDVVCVSPRPYFVFTPMLAATAVGTVEHRSIVESVRVSNPSASYIQAEMVDIFPDQKRITARSALRANETFSIAYDYLIYSAGAVVNDFGLPGVREHCLFVKEVEDVRAIKSRVLENFETAALPGTSHEERNRLLSFVVVGGGPTGVEFTGELSDFLSQELNKLYPDLRQLVTVTLVSAGPSILNSFDPALQERAIESLRRRGVRLLLSCRVSAVDGQRLTVRRKGPQPQEEQLPQVAGLASYSLN